MLTVLIDEHCRCCSAPMRSQFFYCVDWEWWYRLSTDLGTDATPQVDNLWWENASTDKHYTFWYSGWLIYKPLIDYIRCQIHTPLCDCILVIKVSSLWYSVVGLVVAWKHNLDVRIAICKHSGLMEALLQQCRLCDADSYSASYLYNLYLGTVNQCYYEFKS